MPVALRVVAAVAGLVSIAGAAVALNDRAWFDAFLLVDMGALFLGAAAFADNAADWRELKRRFARKPR